MKYKFQVDKKNFESQIANNTTFFSETEMKINKSKFLLRIGESDENGVKSFFLNNRLYQVEVDLDPEGYPRGIYVNGEHFQANLVKIDKLFFFKEKPASIKKSGIVKSFIPGSIKKIYFRTGSQVKEGDIVLIHEAMKMENEIRAPKSGVIKSIGVSEGDNILANHLLFEIE